MYNDQLKKDTIDVDAIYLDPNNPRFWSELNRGMASIADAKVSEAANQARAMEQIKLHGLEELRNSIMRNGFLPLDRIVVRELEGCSGKYVAIEGNRRLAALKWLRESIQQGTISEKGLSQDYLEALVEQTNSIEVLVYDGDRTKDIAWILQGIRHIGGIREWQPAQQGKLVADMIDREGLSLTAAGQQFGLSAQAVGKRYRSYKALEQMRADEEFQSKAENKYYSLFEEALGNKEVKKWLGWDDSERVFTELDNLKQFYAWITPDDDSEEKRRRIHDPRHIKCLGTLIANQQQGLLDQIHDHEIGIEAAYQKLKDSAEKYDWKTALKKVASLIGEIPATSLAENPDEALKLLGAVKEKIENLKSMTEAIQANSDLSKI